MLIKFIMAAMFGFNKTLFVQSRRCPCKADVVRTKREHYSCKVVVVLAKLTLFVQSYRRSLHRVCTKNEESWQVNIDMKTALYHLPHSFFFLREYRVNFFLQLALNES